MSTPTPTVREYKISDDSMQQDSRTTLVHFKEDKAQFIALDDDFKDPFATNWDAAITTAETAPTDEQVVDVQTGFTTAVAAAMEECRVHFQQAKYNIEKAFPDKPAIWNEFGYDNYETARKSPEKQIVFMDVFATTAAKYAAPLIAAKYTQAAIDAIATKRQTLITAKTEQEVAKNSRLGVTQNRIELLNKVWGFRTKVAKAAKVIFATNYAKYKLYLLPASEEVTAIFSVTGTVIDKTSLQALAGVQVSNGVDSTTTDSNGQYGFAKLGNGSYTLTFTFTNYKTSTQNMVFDGTAIVVNATMEK